VATRHGRFTEPKNKYDFPPSDSPAARCAGFPARSQAHNNTISSPVVQLSNRKGAFNMATEQQIAESSSQTHSSARVPGVASGSCSFDAAQADQKHFQILTIREGRIHPNVTKNFSS
jgi:hypothetical protein